MKLLDVQNLSVCFKNQAGSLSVLRDLSFSLDAGKILGLVGESGSGKTVALLSLLRLLPETASVTGQILFYPPKSISPRERGLLANPDFSKVTFTQPDAVSDFADVENTVRVSAEDILGQPMDLVSVSDAEIQNIRGHKIAMIFQEPMTCLNPVLTVGEQIIEVLTTHEGLKKRVAYQKACTILEEVGIREPHQRSKSYPHELSGGLRQRVMIAIALAASPHLLLADEPTTALDVTLQGQILELLVSEVEKRKMSLILVTHDLGVVAETCDEVLVLYAGQTAEKASISTIFKRPKHPYTIGLLGSIPSFWPEAPKHLEAIKGSVPNLKELPLGCTFQERCPQVMNGCKKKPIPIKYVGAGQEVRCINC